LGKVKSVEINLIKKVATVRDCGKALFSAEEKLI
jgi:hypothetical protein